MLGRAQKQVNVGDEPINSRVVGKQEAMELWSQNHFVLIPGSVEAMNAGRPRCGSRVRKALLVIGHVPSEQAGMEECVRWMKTFVKDVPIEFVPTKQPFWTPAERSARH